MIDSGSIHRMENEALRMIMGGQAEALRISVYGFEGDDITVRPFATLSPIAPPRSFSTA